MNSSFFAKKNLPSAFFKKTVLKIWAISGKAFVTAKAYSQPCHASKMENFSKIVNGSQLLTFFHKKLRLSCLTCFWIHLWKVFLFHVAYLHPIFLEKDRHNCFKKHFSKDKAQLFPRTPVEDSLCFYQNQYRFS